MPRSWDVTYPKEENGQTHWPIIGRAFEDPQRKQIVVKLDALPLPHQFTGRIILWERKDD